MTISQKNIYFSFILVLVSFVWGYFTNEIFIKQKTSIISSTGAIYEWEKSKEIYSFIEKYYYGFSSKDREKLEDSYLTSMAVSLGDKYTNYFNKKDSEKFIDSLNGDFQGIGAVIQSHRNGIQIMKVLSWSPAEISKLLNGDIITHVNKESMVGISASEAVDKIRWPKGSNVTLTILSVGSDKKRDVTLMRDTVIVPSIDSRILSGSIGYIEIAMFSDTTSDDVKKAIISLSSSWASSFIIDGRNNGGWYLESSVDILSYFLTGKKVAVITKGTNITDNQKFFTHPERLLIWEKVPLVMLVNSMSASATEILAGALQDHKRALIVWENSYGKWSVQTPFPLSDGSLLKVTTAKWFTPNDRTIDEKWILPDVIIPLSDEDYKKIFDRQLEWAQKLLLKQQKTPLPWDEWKKSAQILITTE